MENSHSKAPKKLAGEHSNLLSDQNRAKIRHLRDLQVISKLKNVVKKLVSQWPQKYNRRLRASSFICTSVVMACRSRSLVHLPSFSAARWVLHQIWWQEINLRQIRLWWGSVEMKSPFSFLKDLRANAILSFQVSAIKSAQKVMRFLMWNSSMKLSWLVISTKWASISLSQENSLRSSLPVRASLSCQFQFQSRYNIWRRKKKKKRKEKIYLIRINGTAGNRF